MAAPFYTGSLDPKTPGDVRCDLETAVVTTNERPATEPTAPGSDGARPARAVWRILWIASVAAIGGLIGFVTGSDYGDLYAPGWRVAGLVGHEAGRLVGLLTGAVVAGLASGCAARRRPRVVLGIGVGAVVGILLTEPLLFGLLPPRHSLLPVAYVGAGAVAAAVGGLLGRLAAHGRRSPSAR